MSAFYTGSSKQKQNFFPRLIRLIDCESSQFWLPRESITYASSKDHFGNTSLRLYEPENQLDLLECQSYDLLPLTCVLLVITEIKSTFVFSKYELQNILLHGRIRPLLFVLIATKGPPNKALQKYTQIIRKLVIEFKSLYNSYQLTVE